MRANNSFDEAWETLVDYGTTRGAAQLYAVPLAMDQARLSQYLEV
jgi:hypothetical protein